MKALVIAALAPLFTLLACLYEGWALAKLWGWHAVPRGLPLVSTVEFTVMLLGYLVLRNGANLRPHPKESRSDEDVALAWLVTLLFPGASVLIGWWLQ